MRLTKKVFNDLAIWMIGFGLLIGEVFRFSRCYWESLRK